jgi:TP901 family phage tail tape measure protein
MADERIVTSIVANSDFSNLIADVQRVSSSLFKLQQEFAGANRALAGQIGAANAMFNQNMLKTGQFSSHFVSLTSDVEKFGKNLDGGRLKLKDYFRVYQENVKTSGGLIRDLAKQQVQLQNAVLQPLGKNAQGLMQYNVHIPRGLDLTKNKTSLLKQELQIMNKVIQDGGIQLINWGKNTQWAGRQLTMGLTLPLVAFGKAAADAFKVADQELTRLTKVYGDVAGTSSQELSRIRKEVSATAKELSGALGVNFSETIALAADIAATGKTGNELLSSVSETTRLAVLGEVDRQEAMKATLSIQTAFKQNTEQLAESINFLNAVENQTSTTLNDLVTAIPKAGPVVKALGGDIQDLALYLTAMREGGINAAESANALKSGLASLINPTKQTVGMMQDFGIDVLGMVQRNAGDTTSLLLDLQSALDQLDPLAKAQAIEQMFGKFQFARISALLNNLGKEGSQTLQVMELMGASVAELEAVAGRELSAVTESAAGKYKRAVEALNAELATTGDGFLNIATKLINVLNKILDFGAKLPDPIKKLMTFAGAFTAIIGPVIMLTGVLANFFGYIIKGLGHFRALFKGAEGFKLLTPEIIAARNASSMLSDEFYSDAKAADTLSLAIKRLNEDLKGLQLNAANATSSTNSLGATIATAAGTPIMTVGSLGSARISDPNHPLIGPQTRAAAHLNPRDPNNPSSIFGLTLQPVPVNRKIGATPQILMSERLPDVPGLTNVGGISTGVVAAEHAKFAALMATLGVQSQQEIDALKKTIGLGGQVSRELLDTFDDILPITQKLTANAAAQSASIVAELKAGTINVQQARAQIIAVNAQLEAMMGAEVSAYAALRGRTIDLTKAPLINQPVVDAAGKPNIRGAYRGGIFLDVMESLGRATGTKTFGGPYSIETTRPIGRNRGGSVPGYINGEYVYMTNGETVPGPNVNADVVPAMLTPGEFVLTRDVVQQQGSDAVEALHRGQAAIVPFGANMGGQVPGYNTGAFIRKMIPVDALAKMFPGRFKPGLTKPLYEPKGTAGVFGGSFNRGDGVAKRFNDILKARGKKPLKSNQITREKINALMSGEGVPPDILLLSMMSGSGARRTSTDEFLQAMVRSKLMNSTEAERLSNLIFKQYAMRLSKMDLINDRNNPLWNVSNLALSSQSPIVKEAWQRFSSTPGMLAGPSRGSLSYLDSFTLSNGTVVQFDPLKGSKVETFYHAGRPDPLKEILKSQGYNRGGRVAGYNRGGRVAGYNRGGRIGKGTPPQYGYARGVQKKILGGGILKMLAAMGVMQVGTSAGQKMGGAGGQALSTASSFLPFMFMGMGPGTGPKPTASQRLGLSGPIGSAYGYGPTLASQMNLTSPASVSTMRQSIFATSTPILGKFAGSVEKAASSSSRLMSSLGKLGLAATRFNVILAISVTAGMKLFGMYKDAKRSAELFSNSFGLTESAAKKAGLQYTDYKQKIKDAIDAQKLFINQNQLTYESMTSANTPFRMTIAEYKKLRKEVKGTMSDQIETLTKASNTDVNRLVVQLKEQLVAAGLSAEEASKRIYTMLQLSNKSGLTVSAMSSERFRGIKDPSSAALSALETFGFARDANPKTGKFDSELNAFNTAMTAIDMAVQSSYEKSQKLAEKKKKDFDETLNLYEAEKKQLEIINSKMSNQKEIGSSFLYILQEHNPELAKFLNSQDTIVSTWQKIRLATRGYTGDLERLNVTQTALVYQLSTEIAKGVEIENQNGLLKDQYKEYNRLKDIQKSLLNAAKGQSVQEQINARDAIRAIDKKIKKINEEADARKKALKEEAQAEDIALKVKEARLEYERRVSAGDLDGAAEAYLGLQRVLNEQETFLTEKAIEDKRKKDLAPLEKERERLSKEQEKLADKAALAADSLESVNNKLLKQKEKIDDVNSAMSALKLAVELNEKDLEKYKTTDQFKGLVANFTSAVAAVGITVPSDSNVSYTKDGGLVVGSSTFGDAALSLMDKSLSNLTTILAQKDINITGTNIIIDGKRLDVGSGTSANPFYAGNASKFINPIDLSGYNGTYGSNSVRESIKQVAESKGYEKGQFFEMEDEKGNIYKFRIRQDGNITMVTNPLKKFDGGPVHGAGTATSDSIPAYLSDGEYVVRASAVDHYGVDTLEAINAKKFKDGGAVYPYNKKGKPTGSPYGPRWGELVRDIHGLAYGRDIWGGTEIPGLKFKGNRPNHSDYWHQMQEQPPKPYRGGSGLSIARDPMGMMGSVPFEGLFGGGLGFGGMLTMANGGYIKGYNLGGKVLKWLAKNVGPKLSGLKGGVDRTVEGLMRHLGMKNDSFDAFESQFKSAPVGPADGQLLRESLEKAIDNAARNKGVLPPNIYGEPTLPMSASQAALLGKEYKDLARFFNRSSRKYKKSGQTVESFNESLKSAKDFMGSLDESRLTKDLNEFLERVDPSDFKKPLSDIDKTFFNIVKNPEEGISGDKFGNLGSGFRTPDLFGGINAPPGISMSEYYAGKALENKIIGSVYRDIAKIAKKDPELAVRLGLLDPRAKYAYGGYVSKFHKGGKVGHKHNVLSKIDSALGGLADKENWEKTANFFALPEMGRTGSDLFRYGNPVSMMAARLSGAEMRSSVGDNFITGLIGIPYAKIPGLNKALSFVGKKFSTFGVDADRGIASMFGKLSGSKPALPSAVASKSLNLNKIHPDFTPEMKSFQMSDIDAKAMQALSEMDLSSIKIPSTGISFNPASAEVALKALKKGESPSNTAWEIVQAQREVLLKKKYPKIDFSDVKAFNEYYAKEFYGLLPDEAIKLFKGVRSTASGAWRTGERDLPTYFSTNPHVAALYSALIGKAKIGSELPMFGVDKKISELRNFLGEGAVRNSNAQGSMEFPQLLGGKGLSDVLPSIYSLPGQVYGQMFGAAATSLTKIKNLWPSGFADGGYINPAYSANMSMPSYKSGVKYLYDDTIAQLHKGEAVIPEHMNPFNPNASAPLSPNYSINNSFTINAADGMDIDALTNKVAAKVEAATARALIKTGTERNISRRYN